MRKLNVKVQIPLKLVNRFLTKIFDKSKDSSATQCVFKNAIKFSTLHFCKR